MLFLQMLSNLSGTIINYSNIARALGVSQPTAREYILIAHGTFIWHHHWFDSGNIHTRRPRNSIRAILLLSP